MWMLQRGVQFQLSYNSAINVLHSFICLSAFIMTSVWPASNSGYRFGREKSCTRDWGRVARFPKPKYGGFYLLAAMPSSLSLSFTPRQCSVFTLCVYSLCVTDFVNLDFSSFDSYGYRYRSKTELALPIKPLHVPSSDSGRHRFQSNIKMADKNRK